MYAAIWQFWTGLGVGFCSNLCLAVLYTRGGVGGNAGLKLKQRLTPRGKAATKVTGDW